MKKFEMYIATALMMTLISGVVAGVVYNICAAWYYVQYKFGAGVVRAMWYYNQLHRCTGLAFVVFLFVMTILVLICGEFKKFYEEDFEKSEG